MLPKDDTNSLLKSGEDVINATNELRNTFEYNAAGQLDDATQRLDSLAFDASETSSIKKRTFAPINSDMLKKSTSDVGHGMQIGYDIEIEDNRKSIGRNIEGFGGYRQGSITDAD